MSADRVNEDNLIVCVAREVFIRYHRFQHTPLDLLVDRLLLSDLPVRGHVVEAMGTDVSAEIFDPFRQDEPIKVKHVIKLVNEFLEQHPDFPLVADTGDALFASVDIRSNECIAPAYYATMGFAVPAALGVQIASGRRPLVLVGDGAFQMTGSEIAHARKYGCNPIVVLLNNSRWEMLQAFFPRRALQRNGRLAVLEARRFVGRPRLPCPYAPAIPRGARRRRSTKADDSR